MEVRVGQGFDVHASSDDPNRALVLGGILFEGERGLIGHSDADALAHSCADALLGAAGLGDIGQLFPDDDDRFEGADSVSLLRDVVVRVTAAGWTIGNVDCTVVCERPRIAPRRDEIQLVMSSVIGAPVSVKASTAERLGAIGRGEGIVCFAVAVVTR
jgi:2-C-methyl-D-erythritol 2,4-cyclodiphosphate synthase